MTLRTTDDSQPAGNSDSRGFVTLIGLFEDIIDARHTLSALRKDGCPRELISLIYRDRKSDEGGPAARHGAPIPPIPRGRRRRDCRRRHACRVLDTGSSAGARAVASYTACRHVTTGQWRTGRRAARR